MGVAAPGKQRETLAQRVPRTLNALLRASGHRSVKSLANRAGVSEADALLVFHKSLKVFETIQKLFYAMGYDADLILHRHGRPRDDKSQRRRDGLE